VNEPLRPGIPTHVDGAVAVNRLGIRDGARDLLTAERVEARGLEVDWPRRVRVGRVALTAPRGLVERDRAGAFPALALLRPGAGTAAPDAVGAVSTPSPESDHPPERDRRPVRATAPSAAPALEIQLASVTRGALSWRDAAVSPRAALDV